MRRFVLLIAVVLAWKACRSPGCGSDRPRAPAPGAPSAAAPEAPTPTPGPPPAPPAGAPARAAWPPPATGEAPPLAPDLLAASYYVIFDSSGSMAGQGCSGNETKSVVSKRVLGEFAASLPPAALLGLTIFDRRGIREYVPLATNNRDAFRRALDSVRPDGNTPLRSAIDRGYGALTAQARRQLGYGEYHLVVVTDGIPDEGEDPSPVVNRLLAESPVVLHTIGFCVGGNHVLNQAGRTFYQAANDPEELRRGLRAVLAEAPSFSADTFR